MKYSHQHGTKNPIIDQEEKSILLSVDRALSSTPNAQTIGKNGELPLISFFNRYLPPTFRAVSGHFLTPGGGISPQIDVMILDSRYPLLAENIDGSVLVMLHSVVQIIEIKTNLTTADVKRIVDNTKIIRKLIGEVDLFDNPGSFKSPITAAVAYRIKNKLETIENAFQDFSEPESAHFDLTILRFSNKDLKSKEVGCELHYEPISDDGFEELKSEHGVPEESFKGSFMFTCRPSYTPLSDIYYSLVQSGYYMLGDRNFSDTDIGKHIMDYMNWSTASWDDIYD